MASSWKVARELEQLCLLYGVIDRLTSFGSCIAFMFAFVVWASTSARIELSIVLDGDSQQACSG
jgi:hypothetical protein